ncbi:MAG: hypothetical protein KAR40_15430 [Candidatus Sabulitectum sp.]|nr:hypothetical protein [Candidatus Sabulitectum sp.]
MEPKLTTLAVLSGDPGAIMAQASASVAGALGIDKFKRLCVDEASNVARETLRAMICLDLTAALDMHIIMEGDAPDGETADGIGLENWTESITEAGEAVLALYAPQLSVNVSTVQLENITFTNFLNTAPGPLVAMASDIVESMLVDRGTDTKKLSAFGITTAMLKEVLASRTDSVDRDAVRLGAAQAISSLVTSGDLGTTSDDMTGDLDLLSDDDDGLAHGAANRLCITVEDVEHLRTFRRTFGRKAVETMASAWLGLSLDPNASAEPWFLVEAGAVSAPNAASANPQAADTVSENTSSKGAIDPRVLSALKTYTSAKDKDIAEELGMSRASFNSKCNGKGEPLHLAAHKAVIAKILDEHIKPLTEARILLGV